MTTTMNATTERENPGEEEVMTTTSRPDSSSGGLVTEGLLDDFMAKVNRGDLALVSPECLSGMSGEVSAAMMVCSRSRLPSRRYSESQASDRSTTHRCLTGMHVCRDGFLTISILRRSRAARLSRP